MAGTALGLHNLSFSHTFTHITALNELFKSTYFSILDIFEAEWDNRCYDYQESDLVTKPLATEAQSLDYPFACRVTCRSHNFKYAYAVDDVSNSYCSCTSDAPVKRESCRGDSRRLITTGFGHSSLSLAGNLNTPETSQPGNPVAASANDVIDTKMIKVCYIHNYSTTCHHNWAPNFQV